MSRTGWSVAAALAVHAAVLFGVQFDHRERDARLEETVVVVALVGPREDAASVAPDPLPAAPPPSPPPPRSEPQPVPPEPRKPVDRAAPPRAEPEAPAPAIEPPSAPAPAVPGGSERGAARAARSGAPSPPSARGLVTARPRYKRSPEPAYPLDARRRRQQGTVVLAVHVDAGGRPESVDIATSSGFSALDAAAVKAVKAWEFEPARLDGEAVASRVEVPIRFELR